MEIEKIWKQFNISFILVLPLFKGIIENIKTKENYNISIHSLFYEYGLINCYLLNNKSKYNGYLRLVFKKESILVCDLLDKLDKPIASLLDLIISSKYFDTIKDTDDYIIIYLKIDNKWNKDIKHIINSQYSKVSSEYKNYITYTGMYSLSENDIINYLYLKNIPAKIIIKHKSLQDNIISIFNYDSKDDLPEVFTSFDIKKESLNLKT
jgi:hypothetical protein